jgi:Flp pilus assembly protein TadD
MPSSQSKDVVHTQVTNHRIPRHPEASDQPLASADQHASPRLVPFPGSAKPGSAEAGSVEAGNDVRDLALAWESLAEGGVETAAPEAERRLRSSLEKSPNDPAVLSALGYIKQMHGATDGARELYEKALAHDPDSIDAATNLGVIEARSGHIREAVRLWEGAFQRAPGRSAIGMNIARVFCEEGKFDEARSFTARVLEFNPDLGAAKRLLHNLNHTPASCGS